MYDNANKGNVRYKSDAGDYVYDANKPFALSALQDPEPALSTMQQDISYTPYNQPLEIEENGLKLQYRYGPNEQRRVSELFDVQDNLVKKIYYSGNYERIETNGNTYEVNYLSSPEGLFAIAVKENENPVQVYYTETDHLGSILGLYNVTGQPFYTQSFDAWGRERNPDTWDYTSNTGSKPEWLIRGYTGHEHLEEQLSPFGGVGGGLINMNGRMYDPILGRMLSPDNYIQDATSTQSFNRYSYVWNNPLKYTDPEGEIVWMPIIIGAVVGTYLGGSIANENYNPAQWDYNSAKTWGYMVGGAIVGAASGHLGGAIATSGMQMANTAGIAGASFVNSVGTAVYTRGQTDVSISLGVASYNFDKNEWGYLGKKGNSALENIGYGFGALANLGDAVSLFSGGGQNVKVNSASTKDGNEWWGHSSITDENSSSLVSVGPDGQVQKAASLSKTWQNSIKVADSKWSTYLGKKGTWSVDMNNVSTTAISKYASGVTRWDLLLNSCVGHTSRALWTAGIPNVYAFHPHMLNLQLAIRQIGIYSSPYLYQMR